MNDCAADAVPTTVLNAVNVPPVTLTAAAPASVTVKSVALVAVVCPATSTVILPVVAPLGTVAVIEVAVETVIVPAVPLNLTVGEEKFDPLIVTLVPTAPELGLNPLIVGTVPPLSAEAINLKLSKRLLPDEVVAPEKVART